MWLKYTASEVKLGLSTSFKSAVNDTLEAETVVNVKWIDSNVNVFGKSPISWFYVLINLFNFVRAEYKLLFDQISLARYKQ